MDAIAARGALLIRSSMHQFPGCRQMYIRDPRLQSAFNYVAFDSS